MKRDAQGRTPTEREALSVGETARVLGLGRGAAYQAVASGEIPSLRIGGRILVPRRQLERLLDGSTEGPREP